MTPSAPKGSSLNNLFESLADLGTEYAGSISGGTGGKFACPNPGHDDAHASFDVHLGRNGKAIFTCTPCRDAMGQDDYIEVLRDLGVVWSGGPLTDDDPIDWGPAAEVVSATTKGGKGGVHLVDVYTYNHADGKPNFKISRYDPDEGSEARKTFRPKRYETGNGWIGGSGALDGVERTPLYLERFEEWAKTDLPVITMVEGEKAAKHMAETLGLPATTFHGGTSGKTEPDWVRKYGFDRFTVSLWPDADEAGVERMLRLADDLRAAGVTYQYVGVLPCKANDDAFDLPIIDVHGLTDADLDHLKSLAPKPVQRVSTRNATEAAESPVIGGKALMPARGYEAPQGGSAPAPHTDPYECSIGQAPYEFTAEMVEREFMTDGVLTLRFRVDDRSFWHWSGIRYVRMTDDEVNATLKQRLAGKWECFQPKDGPIEARPIKVTEAKIKEVTNHLRSLTLTSDYGAGSLRAPIGTIPFLNGLLDVESGDLRPITADLDIRWNVPADYDPSAKCPEWIKFLTSIGWGPGTEEYRLLRQWIGYVISGAINIHKGCLLIGPRRCGKGTILGITEALMGEGAVGIQLDSFSNNFGMQSLIGKGLATVGDARFGFRTDKALVERLLSLTGFDLMQIDAKFKDPLSIRLGTRLMVASNEVPAFVEASDALAGRFITLETSESFFGREDLTLKSRLMTELPGIARWALFGYRELIGLGSFTETERGLVIQQQMVNDANPIRVFIEEECLLDAARSVDKQELFDRYLLWAEKTNTYRPSRSVFFRDLQTAFPGKFTDSQMRKGTTRVRVLNGLCFR